MRPIAAIAAVFLLAISPARGDACSAAYHERLGGIAAQRGDGLASLYADLRASDAALPGRWLFNYDPKLEKRGRVRISPVTSEACIRYEGRGRRAKCVETETRVVPSNEVAFAFPADQAELQSVRALQDFVMQRGAVPEAGNNGKLTWLFQKLAQDLRAYVTQPAHPALCTGGGEVSEFYSAQAAPLEKRVQDIRTLADAARSRAIERTSTLTTSAASASIAVVTASAGPTLPVPAVAREVQPDHAARGTVRSIELLHKVLQPVLASEQMSDVAEEATVFAALRRAKTFLIDRQDALSIAQGSRSAGGPDGSATAVAVPDAKSRQELGRALSAIEVLAYAELLEARYETVRSGLVATPRDIRDAHAAACGCAE